MNPLQLRETTIDPDTRRQVQLVLDGDDDTDEQHGYVAGQEACLRSAQLAGE